MEDSPEKQSNSMSDSNKSTGRPASEKSSCTATHISSSNYSDATTSIAYEYDESVEIKEEIIDDQDRYQGGEYNLLSGNNQLNEKYLSSGNKSAPKTWIVYENDETLEIKEEIIQEQSNFMSDSNKSTERLAAETFSCTTTHISTSNCSDSKTSIVYGCGESVEIKKEIIEDTVSGQKIEQKYESTLNTVDTREADILARNELQTHERKKIQESKTEAEKKYKCQKCARSYKHKYSLNFHQRFECNVVPHFVCKFCDKQFKQKCHMNRHIGQMHQKIKSNQNKEKIEESEQEPEKNHNMYRHQITNLNIFAKIYNCNKCFQSYNLLHSLKQHERFKHALVQVEFTCDVCGYKTNRKSNLSKHISSRHFKNSKTRYNCPKCSLNYSLLGGLKRHNRVKHATVKPEFTCDVCAHKTNLKSNMSKHISSRHFKNSKTLKARHNCDECSLNYSSLDALKRHNHLKHAAAKPEFICDVCSYKTNLKSNLSRHISSRHLK